MSDTDCAKGWATQANRKLDIRENLPRRSKGHFCILGVIELAMEPAMLALELAAKACAARSCCIGDKSGAACIEPSNGAGADGVPTDAICDCSANNACGVRPSGGKGGNKLETGALRGRTLWATRDRRAGFRAKDDSGSNPALKTRCASLDTDPVEVFPLWAFLSNVSSPPRPEVLEAVSPPETAATPPEASVSLVLIFADNAVSDRTSKERQLVVPFT